MTQSCHLNDWPTSTYIQINRTKVVGTRYLKAFNLKVLSNILGVSNSKMACK